MPLILGIPAETLNIIKVWEILDSHHGWMYYIAKNTKPHLGETLSTGILQ